MEKLIAYTEARSVTQSHTRSSAPNSNIVKPRDFHPFSRFCLVCPIKIMNSPLASASRHHYSPGTNSYQCLQIQTLFQAGHDRKFIAEFLNISYRQLIGIIAMDTYSPKKPSGQPRKISQSRGDELGAYVRSTKEARQMSYTDLAAKFAHWGVGAYAINGALRERGHFRHLSRAKPPLA
ncbi:hypothetical protein K3495_g7254 [Podosphaera aphanis]|nr:hypothetical protein K3495_g7254 [Podosphaera aphanis]